MRGRAKNGRRKTADREDAQVPALRGDARPARRGSAPADEASGNEGGGVPQGSIRPGLAESSSGNPVLPLVEESIKPAELASIPKASAEPSPSGIDAARKAVEGEPSQALSIATEEAIEGSLQLCETALAVVCAIVGSKAEPEELERAAKFTPGERGMLRMFSPAVAPHLGVLARRSPEIAVGSFVVCFAVIAWGRVRKLSRSAKSSGETSPQPKAPEPRAPRTVTTAELEHRKLWGSAADAVKPGTKVVDIGLPPKFTPKLDRMEA